MSLVLECKAGGDYKPHPEGIYPAVCVDMIELGMMEVEFQGQRKLVNKVRLVFETEQKNEEGRNWTLAKTYTASLHPKARLTGDLGKWRGRPIVPGESIHLAKLIGACCTLVVSHQQNLVGRTYASIDAISKPTRKVTPSGGYDPALARQRIAEWKARDQAAPGPNAPAGAGANGVRPLNSVAAVFPQSGAASAAVSKSPAPAPAPEPEFDPEVGF